MCFQCSPLAADHQYAIMTELQEKWLSSSKPELAPASATRETWGPSFGEVRYHCTSDHCMISGKHQVTIMAGNESMKTGPILMLGGEGVDRNHIDFHVANPAFRR